MYILYQVNTRCFMNTFTMSTQWICITIDIKFGTWTYYENGGISQRMPWYVNNSGFITTSTEGGGYWWGTLIASSWNPVTPWMENGCGIEGCMPNPVIIWYWVR